MFFGSKPASAYSHILKNLNFALKLKITYLKDFFTKPDQ